MNNVQAALAVGKEVVIHESPINFGGFSGAGYIITDPQTGAGAYLIEGGARGMIWLMFLLLAIIAIAPIFLTGVGFFSLLGAFIAIQQAREFSQKLTEISNLPIEKQISIFDGYIFLLIQEAISTIFIGIKARQAAGFERELRK